MNSLNPKEKKIINAFGAVHAFVFRFSVMLALCCLLLAVVDALVMKSKISGEKFLYLALLSVLVSLSMSITDLLKSKHINNVITYTVNFLLCYLSFAVVFYFMRNDIAESSFNTPALSFILLSCVFVLAYTAIAIVRIIGGALKRKMLSRAKTYEKVYNDEVK